jgi:Uma2 family endonuclease
MAAVAEPLLMTVEQYRQLHERDDVLQELHWGQLITLTRPKARHVKLQSRLVRLLRPKAEHLGYVESELPFRALPEYDLRAADVAFVAKQRWDEVQDDDDLRGAPELVIEVLSRSNTPAKIQELAALCLSARNPGALGHRCQTRDGNHHQPPRNQHGLRPRGPDSAFVVRRRSGSI